MLQYGLETYGWEWSEQEFSELTEGILSVISAHSVSNRIKPIHKAQLVSYKKLFEIPVGLTIDCHELKLTDGASNPRGYFFASCFIQEPTKREAAEKTKATELPNSVAFALFC